MHSLLLVILAAAPGGLSYGTGDLQLKRLADTPEATLMQQIVACTRGYGVTRVERTGAPARLVWDATTDALTETSRAEKVALLSILGRKLVGVEVDVLVPQPDGAGVPVSVTWELNGVVTFESGPPVKSLLDETMTAAKIKSQFEVGEFIELDAKWDGAAFSLVQQALATLSKEELALVRGLHYRRAKADGIHAAKYERGDESNWINVYKGALANNDQMFTGSAAAPRALGLLTMIHELGHALADARFREKGLLSKAASDEYRLHKGEVDAAINAYNERAQALGPNPPPRGVGELKALEAALTRARAENDARFKEADRLVKQMLANDRANASGGRSAEKAYAAVFAQNQCPTTYGRTRPAEHFAECFTLFKNDPVAFRRISPVAADWFTAGNHVTISGQALDP